eukprot:TRINITY_DN1062_c0_g1_i7.p3 TRINITY_DN1062_c0_g1~~TRINITY_DN1062_c0_g1_i7.p3  ORF type:complete len:135 (+),score=11.32 TRINITY_DN1062_c0_g1_i7:1061-1465(+)
MQLSGKLAAGNTSTIANLCGLEVPSTTGIQMGGTLWPSKLSDGTVSVFKLRFSQAGASCLEKYRGLADAFFSGTTFLSRLRPFLVRTSQFGYPFAHVAPCSLQCSWLFGHVACVLQSVCAFRVCGTVPIGSSGH